MELMDLQALRAMPVLLVLQVLQALPVQMELTGLPALKAPQVSAGVLQELPAQQGSPAQPELVVELRELQVRKV